MEERRVILFSLSVIVGVLLVAGSAMATWAIHRNWEAFCGFGDANPVDDSLTDAGSTECQVCHRDSHGGQPWNAYGWELHLNNVNFNAADHVDSDGDGTTNGEEIEFLDANGYGAQPGWTSNSSADPGNIECFDQASNFGCFRIPSELVPATAGRLDLPLSDPDGDGVDSQFDNCSLRANPGQDDTDGDGCGNICDADYGQSGTVSIADFGQFLQCFGTTNEVCQHREPIGGRLVGIGDFGFFVGNFGTVPGPSGTTAGTTACP